MKAVLTCDDVFDVLTREPFPSGGPDDEVVESHLAVCHECRQLAEAFRPAVGLFHESLSAGFDDELPMYRGRLKPLSLFAPRKDECSPSEQRRSSMRRSFAIAASLVLVGSVVVAILSTSPGDSDSVPRMSTVGVLEDRDYTLLATLEIPSSCRSPLEHSDRAFTTEFVCCTKCHHATSRVASTNRAVKETSAACAACHDRMRGDRAPSDAVPSDAVSMVAPRNQLCESLLASASIHNL